MRKPVKRAKLMAEINITPFTDVVLVLLIIFMVTTPMLMQPGIKVKLPKAKAAETDQDKTVSILIDQEGRIYLENKQVEKERLQSVLSAKVFSRPDLAVVIKGDKEVKYDSVISVIDAAKQAGAKKFALAVEMIGGPKEKK